MLTLVILYKHKPNLSNIDVVNYWQNVKFRNNQILLRSHRSELCKRIHKVFLYYNSQPHSLLLFDSLVFIRLMNIHILFYLIDIQV